ncbi:MULTISPECIES: hypothetical protein [Bifidobacterium]|uniref:Uncharacterized protein n=2 Tax=Bifidobacterium TaxID=1678 RepID=A0A087DG19_9BIFI|nr:MULTISPECIES: hypothetical protein [Bifidobacterium]KFI94469.1 hypothetical protein BSTEL_2080 [Bifidobacterium stellenboschense]PLS28929.1 hypothetical protein Uis4E_0864 [Bifidobacterium parmae]
MSFKDSMIRGLAMYGASTMAQHSMGNTKVLSDLVNESDKLGR